MCVGGFNRGKKFFKVRSKFKASTEGAYGEGRYD